MCYHPGFRVIPVIGVFIRKERSYAQREAKERSPLKRCCRKPGGTGRCKKHSPLELSGARPCQHFDFRPLEL